MPEPTPEQYTPPMTRWGTTWRVLLVIAISVLVWSANGIQQWKYARGLFWLDLALGLVSFVLMFYRRRWPLPIATVITVLGIASASAGGPGLLAVVSLATRRRLSQVVFIGVLNLVTAPIYELYEPVANKSPLWVSYFTIAVFTVAALASGMYIGSRRELLWTLRNRATRAEAEQESRVREAQVSERARIAREMHDVLAHRISLVTMHAGALAYRDDLTAAEIKQTAELIQTKAHEALTDLRHVLGVLRDDDAAVLDRPQPTFADLPQLIREAEEAGMSIAFTDEVAQSARLPDQVGRATYRIVQEGLTNARKHAPGSLVHVAVTGSPESGVGVLVRNPARGTEPGRTPGAGLGLIGLAERAKLGGGRLDGRRVNGTFELRGWLPWGS